MLFLTNHLWLSGLLFLGATTLIAMAGPIIVRRQVSLERLIENNEVAGFKFAVIGVLYQRLITKRISIGIAPDINAAVSCCDTEWLSI